MRKGQWGCERCAARDGLPWGEGQYSSQSGWCGLGHHRVTTRLEFIEDADPGERVNPAPAPIPPVTVVSKPKSEPAAPAPQKQMELF